MTAYAGLLRAVNVGGTGKLAMSDLRRICEDCGLTRVATHIQSGNVVFQSRRAEAGVKQLLEQALAKHLGKPCEVLIRTAAELRELLEDPPFADAPPNRVIVLFLAQAPPADCLKAVVAPGGEQLALRGRELFIYYPQGQGATKLKLPFQKTGTGRNLNTVRRLLEMLEALA